MTFKFNCSTALTCSTIPLRSTLQQDLNESVSITEQAAGAGTANRLFEYLRRRGAFPERWNVRNRRYIYANVASSAATSPVSQAGQGRHFSDSDLFTVTDPTCPRASVVKPRKSTGTSSIARHIVAVAKTSDEKPQRTSGRGQRGKRDRNLLYSIYYIQLPDSALDSSSKSNPQIRPVNLAVSFK